MDLEIKIVEKNNAIKLLGDENFISKWKGLARSSKGVTVMQEPAFVKTWYETYSNIYQPILVLGFDNKSELIGLLPLSSENNSIIHAGAMQAEYHGWLSKKEFDQDFIVKAIIAIKQNFKLPKWAWGWTPPHSTLNWLTSEALKKERIFVKSTEHDCPILDLNDESKIEKLKKNRSIRNKINRYTKQGDFHIERIINKDDAIKIFDTLEKQCDFRKITLGHIPPFVNDSNKKQFLIEKLDYPENTHFTILWSNNNPIAFHIGECDSDTAYLTLISHDPIEAKNSPGKILLIKLFELLKDEGFRYFDLTPGGDEYKEAYGNSSRKVFHLIIYFNKKDKIISDLKDLIKKTINNSIIFLGAQPNIIANKVSQVSTIIKKIISSRPSEIFRKIISSVYKKETFIYYKISTNNMPVEAFKVDKNININNYSDLFLKTDNNLLNGKSDLISQAQRKFNSGDVLYTKVINGVLAQYGWMAKRWQKHINSNIHEKFEILDDSVFLYDFNTDASYLNQDLLSEMLKRIFFDNKNNDVKDLIISFKKNDISLRDAIEKIGFKVYFKITRKNILWKTNTTVYS